MAKHWDALVFGDYEAVMPLTWNKKYGFYYLYQPAFTASLGVFGKSIDGTLVKNFLDSIPKKFKLIEISLNHGNNFPDAIKGYYPRSNYILDLNRTYEELLHGYRENHRRNILKAKEVGSRISKEISVDEIIRINQEQLKHIDGTKPEDYIHFRNLYGFLKDKQQAKTYAVVNPTNKIACFSSFLFLT